MEVCKSLIDKINNSSSSTSGLHFVSPLPCCRTNEFDLVRGVLQLLQGFSSPLFDWRETEGGDGYSYRVKNGLYVSHLSETSLGMALDEFMYSATCLKLVEITLSNIISPPPTLRAFVSSASACLRKLRDIALNEQVKMSNPNSGTTPTLLGLSSSLTRILTADRAWCHS